MTPSQQHDTDFYRWTQDQAALLRALPRSSNHLDIDNLAEEIEAMGEPRSRKSRACSDRRSRISSRSHSTGKRRPLPIGSAKLPRFRLMPFSRSYQD